VGAGTVDVAGTCCSVVAVGKTIVGDGDGIVMVAVGPIGSVGDAITMAVSVGISTVKVGTAVVIG
jgi:hypothetical protein